MTECHIPFSGHCDLDLWPSFKTYYVRCIFLIFFEVGIPNLVSGCILGWGSVTFHFRVTVTLTSDLVFRIIMSGAYFILFKVGISNLVCGCILEWQSVTYNNLVTVTLNLTSDLVSRNCIESGAYLLFFEIGIPNLMCKFILDADVSHTICRSLWSLPMT